MEILFRPYTHADALYLLLNCLNQIVERVKNTGKSSSAVNYEYFANFRENIVRLEQEISEFVRIIKEQQQKQKKKRIHRLNQLTDVPITENTSIETKPDRVEESRSASPISSISRIMTPPLSSAPTINDNPSDDEEPFEMIGSATQLVDLLRGEFRQDEETEEEEDPFAMADMHEYNQDPFSIVPSDNNVRLMATTTNLVNEQESIDPFEIPQPKENSTEENLLAFYDLHKTTFDSMASSISSSTRYGHEVNHLTQAFQSIDTVLKMIPNNLNDICKHICDENGIILMKVRCENIIEEIRRAIEKGKSNIFFFQDGLVATAVKEGKILVLEDINEPSQAVIERLNSLFEIEPSFILYEDFTTQHSTTVSRIPILPTFQVFATVHTNERTENRLQLSAATRSRMTEIRVQPYDNNELKQLAMKSQLNDQTSGGKLVQIVEIFANQLAPEIAQVMKIDSLDSRHFVQFGQCLHLHLQHMPIEQAAALCVKFLFPDGFHEMRKSTVSTLQPVDAFWQKVMEAFDCPKDCTTTDENLEKLGVCTEIDQWCEVKRMTMEKSTSERWGLRLRSNGLIAPFAPKVKSIPNDLKFPLVLTKSVLNNISRVLFSLPSSTRQLFIGPPGIGKTKIIEVLAKMLGYDVVRINFSSNTTFEDLVGSFVPRVVHGQRSFEFQEGPLYIALGKNRHDTVVLLDELNLARKELLNQLTPLFANEKQFYIPALGKSIPIDGSIIVAAMNPAFTGGGREKLPRSIQAHFIQVQLAPFEIYELMQITISLLRPHLDANYLTNRLVEKINQFHYEISEYARLRKIGRVGGPYDFNLRDIEKLSNLIAALSVTHHAHMNLSDGRSLPTTHASASDNLSKIEEQNLIRSLHVYLEIVYASRFECVDDQKLVRQMIQQHFILENSTEENQRQSIIDSDLNLQGYVRLGFVYIEKKEYPSYYRPCIHSPRTLEKLQLLAAATVSKATVLIEGDDCSGKTAIVCELARVCGRQLIILNLNHETTTSDLLGSWAAVNKHSYQNRRKQNSQQLLTSIVRFTLITLLPMAQQYQDIEKLIEKLTCMLEHWENGKFLQSNPSCNSHCLICIENVDLTQDAFQQCRSLLENAWERSTQIQEQSISNEIEKYFDQLDQIENDFKLVQNLAEGLTFTFNKGPLIQAMERGDWILLDNINCARGDVIERLNSLAEAEPTLTLYESTPVHQYCRGDGIHKDFRLFVIANSNRKMANKLSNAWRNRCLILRMQPLDDQLTIDNVRQHDLAEIVKGELQGINAGLELTHTLLRVHASAQQLVKTKDIQLITSYRYSYQNVKRSTQILRTSASHGKDPVFALKSAIFRVYLDPIINKKGKKALIQAFIQHLSHPELKKTTYSTLPVLYSLMPIDDHQQQMEWYKTAQNLHDHLGVIEECTLDLHLRIISQYFTDDLCNKQEFDDYVLSFIDFIQPLLKSKQNDENIDDQISNIRSKCLINRNQQSSTLEGIELKNFLVSIHENLQSRKILSSFERPENTQQLLSDTINQSLKQILDFVHQTSFLDAQYRLNEFQRFNETIHQLIFLTKKLRLISKYPRTSIIDEWNLIIEENLQKLLIIEIYMKWVAFPCQPMSKNDLHILSQTQEFLREQNQVIHDEENNALTSSLQLINVHLQKVQSLPIIFSADQRLDIMFKLYHYLSAMKDKKFLLIAAAKLELNVACKLTMNLMIKSDFIEKIDEQFDRFNSDNLLTSLNLIFFIHTILSKIFEEIGSCYGQLEQIKNQYRTQEELVLADFNEIDEKIRNIHRTTDVILQSEQTSDIDIETQLEMSRLQENQLNEKKFQHIDAVKTIEKLSDDIKILFTPLRQSLERFEGYGWLKDIQNYRHRREENLLHQLLETISKLYQKEYDFNQTYPSSNLLINENQQLKSDILRGEIFEKIPFDNLNTSSGHASLALMQLVYPHLFQQHILLYIFKEDHSISIVKKCLELHNNIDIIITAPLTNFLLIDKRLYNRYSINPSGLAHLDQQITIIHFIVERQTNPIPIDDNFLQLISQVENQIQQRSINTKIDIERKLISMTVDDDLMPFVLPVVLQQLFENPIIPDDINSKIESKHFRQLRNGIQHWIDDQQRLGVIRNDQRMFQTSVENEIQSDIALFLTIIDHVKLIVTQTSPSATIDLRQLSKSVDQIRRELERQIITKLKTKLDGTLHMCVPKEVISKARTLAIVREKQFRYPVLNQLQEKLSDSQTKFHLFISMIIDRLHIIQAVFLQIILKNQNNTNPIDLYINTHKISKLLISIITYLMEHIDTHGLIIPVTTFQETMNNFNQEIFKSAAAIQYQTIEQMNPDQTQELTLFTKAELDAAIEGVTRVVTNSTVSIPVRLDTTEIIKKDAEEAMLDRQNEELTKIEHELEQLRHIAKQNDRSRIQYAIAMLLMELNEIRRNKTILNEISLLQWRESPKQIQRCIVNESIEHKKNDIFDLKRVEHEKPMEISTDMIQKTIAKSNEIPSTFSDEERRTLLASVKSLTDDKCSETDPALTFLIDYFHRQTYEFMWNKVEKSIYELCSTTESNSSAKSIMENLKSLMATFIFLDSTSSAKICRELLQFCQEHVQNLDDRFNLPAPRLRELQTKTLTSIIEQRYTELLRLNPCDKTNLLLITSNDQDVQSCRLIDIHPLLIRLKNRHEKLIQILHDQASYKQIVGIQISYLRFSDCLALLFPELSTLFLESLQLDTFNFQYINRLETYLHEDQFRTSIKDLHEHRFLLKIEKNPSISLLSNESKIVQQSIENFIKRMKDIGQKENRFQHLIESNEYHAFFALELQALLSTIFEEVQENLRAFLKQLQQPNNYLATDYLIFSDQMINEYGSERRACQSRKLAIENTLNEPSLTEDQRSSLGIERMNADGECEKAGKEHQKRMNDQAIKRIDQFLQMHHRLQMKSNSLAAQLIDTIRNRAVPIDDAQQKTEFITSRDFYEDLFQIKSDLLKSPQVEFNEVQIRLNTSLDRFTREFKEIYDESRNHLHWLTDTDKLHQLFHRFLLAYQLSHSQLFNVLRNWFNDIFNQRKSYAKEIEKNIEEIFVIISATFTTVRPIIQTTEISSITLDVNTLHRNVQELSRIARQMEKFASTARVVYSAKVLSIVLYHCSSFYARLAILLIQLFKNQQSSPLILSQLKSKSIIIENQSMEWDDNMKEIMLLSGFRERSDIPGTILSNDEYSMKEIHQRLCQDFLLIENSFQYRYSLALSDICFNPAALIDNIERKMKILLQVANDWNENERSSESKSNGLIRVSYTLNILVHHIQHLLMKILENPDDSFEPKTMQNLEIFLQRLRTFIHFSCPSTLETMFTVLIDYILKDELDLFFDVGLAFVDVLYAERTKLKEYLPHLRRMIENFVDQFFIFFIQLIRQRQMKKIQILQQQQHNRLNIQTLVSLEEISLLETLNVSNRVAYIDHLTDIDQELDWYSQLAQFLIQGWLQASHILREFTAPLTRTHRMSSERLRYSLLVQLLNEEGKRIVLFLQQTIGQFKRKYPSREKLDGEPVIIYLLRLTKFFRYELMRISMISLQQSQLSLNNDYLHTSQPGRKQMDLTMENWQNEINLLLGRREQIKESYIKRMKDEHFNSTRAIEEINKRLETEYSSKCRQVDELMQRTRDSSIGIVKEIKLITRLIYDAQPPSNDFYIEDVSSVTSDVVGVIECLSRMQQILPEPCQLDKNKEGKDLIQLIRLNAIRVEVQRVNYSYTEPRYIKSNIPYQWDNKIQFKLLEKEKSMNEGPSMPLKTWATTNYVKHLFTYDIPIQCDYAALPDTAACLILLAGVEKDNLWTKMATIRLPYAELCQVNNSERTYPFRHYGQITVRFTRIFDVQLTATTNSQSVDQPTSENWREQEQSSATTVDVTNDPYVALRIQYESLNPKNRTINLQKRLQSLKQQCDNIEKKFQSHFIKPQVPLYVSKPEQKDLTHIPEFGRTQDLQALNRSSPPTHHYLMMQLSSNYTIFRQSVVETITRLKNFVSAEDFTHMECAIIKGFDAPDSFQRNMTIFQEVFRFDKLTNILSELHQHLMIVHNAWQSFSAFREKLKWSLGDLNQSGFHIQLRNDNGAISDQKADRLYTNEMNKLINHVLQIIQDELAFTREISVRLILMEANLAYIIIHSLETKEQCNDAKNLIEEIKQYWFERNPQIGIFVFDEILTSIQERRKRMRTISSALPEFNPNEIDKAVNVKALMKSTGSPMISKMIISKQNGEYCSSCSSLRIQMEQIILHWSSTQSKTKTIQIINSSDEEILFQLSANSDEKSSSIFTIQPLSSIIPSKDMQSIKILANDQVKEGKYEEQWQLKFPSQRLIIPLVICCEIKQFSIEINVPCQETSADQSSPSQIKTYLIDFGTVAACSNASLSQSFTIRNPTSLDLRVKIRRESGGVGRFEIDNNKYSTFILLAYESKTVDIRWNLFGFVGNASCTYEIYFSKNYKCQLMCVGKSRRVAYDILYRSRILPKGEFFQKLEPCIPNSFLCEELIILNIGEVQIFMAATTNDSSTARNTILSHQQASIPVGQSLTLKVQLDTTHPSQLQKNIIYLNFPTATLYSSFTATFQTTIGWPELYTSLLASLKALQVGEDIDMKTDQIMLRNKGPVTMTIDQIHSTSSSVTINNSIRFPLDISPKHTVPCPIIYRVQKKLALFKCEFILHTNCEQSIQRIPFHCKRLAPIISLHQNILHCGSKLPGAQQSEFSIIVQNDGNVTAKLQFEKKENSIFSFRVVASDCHFTLDPTEFRLIKCVIEINKKALKGNFKGDVPFAVTGSSQKLTKENKFIVTGRVRTPEETSSDFISINLPSLQQFFMHSSTQQKIETFLEDNRDPSCQRAVTALCPLMILIDSLPSFDPKLAALIKDYSCDRILSIIKSKPVEVSLYITNNCPQIPAIQNQSWHVFFLKIKNILEEHLPKAINGIETKTVEENQQLALDCAERLSVFFEEHVSMPEEQILARLIEYERHNHLDASKEHAARKRLVDYAFDLMMNQSVQRTLPYERKQQLDLLMDKIVDSMTTAEQTQNLLQVIETVLTEIMTGHNQKYLNFFNQLLKCVLKTQPLNEDMIIRKMYDFNLPLNSLQLVTENPFTSNGTESISTLLDFICGQLEETNPSRRLLYFMRLSEKIANDKHHASTDDFLELLYTFACISSDLDTTEVLTLRYLQSLLLHLAKGIYRSSNDEQYWSRLIGDLHSTLSLHLEKNVVQALRMLLHIVLISDPTTLCNDEQYLNIISSMLLLGSEECQRLSNDIRRCAKIKDPLELLDIAISLIRHGPQFLEKNPPWIRTIQQEFKKILSSSPSSTLTKASLMTIQESMRADLMLTNSRRSSQSLGTLFNAVRNKELAATMESLSDLDGEIRPNYRREQVNHCLIHIVSLLGSTTTTPFKAIASGIRLTILMNDPSTRIPFFTSSRESSQMSLDHLNTLLQNYQSAISVINNRPDKSMVSVLINEIIQCIPDLTLRQGIQPIGRAIRELNGKNEALKIISEVLCLIPDTQLSDHAKSIFTSISETINGDIKQMIIEFAEQLCFTNGSKSAEISLGTILKQGLNEPSEALKSIAALLPENIRLGFSEVIKQRRLTIEDQNQTVQKITDLYGSHTGYALQLSFKALNSLATNKLEALKNLTQLFPNTKSQHIFESLDRFSSLTSCERKDLVKITLELTSLMMTPRQTSIALQTVANIYDQLIQHQGTSAVKIALSLFPNKREQAEKILLSINHLCNEPLPSKNILEVVFDVTGNLVDENTIQSMMALEKIIQHIQNNDLRQARNLIADKYLSENPRKLDLAMTITDTCAKAFIQNHDPLHVLKSLLNANDLKPHLPSTLHHIYRIYIELRKTIHRRDTLRMELATHALYLMVSFLPNDQATKVRSVADLLHARQSGESRKIIDQSVQTMRAFLPRRHQRIVELIEPLLIKRLNNQLISYEDLIAIACLLLDDKQQQHILENAFSSIRIFMGPIRPSNDQYLDAAVKLSQIFGVTKEKIEQVEKLTVVRSNIKEMAVALSALSVATTTATKARQIITITTTTLSLLNNLIPNLPQSVKYAFQAISAIAKLLKATNTMSLVLAALELASTIFDTLTDLNNNLTNGNSQDATFTITDNNNDSTTSKRNRVDEVSSGMRQMKDYFDILSGRADISRIHFQTIASDTNGTVRNKDRVDPAANQEDKNRGNHSQTTTSVCPLTTGLVRGDDPDFNSLESPPIMNEATSVNGQEAEEEIKTLTDQAIQFNRNSEQQVSHLVQRDQLVLSETITYLSTATLINKTIQATMNTLQQMAVNHMRTEIKRLAQTTLPDLILTSLQLFQSLNWISQFTGDIAGHIKDKCHQIQVDLIQVLDKLSASESLRKLWKLAKKNELVEDYTIPEDGQILDSSDAMQSQQQQQHQQQRTVLDHIKEMMHAFEGSNFGQGEIIGDPTLHRFGVYLDNLLSNYDNDPNRPDENAEESKPKSDTERSATPKIDRPAIANRDIILQIDDQGSIKHSLTAKSKTGVQTKLTNLMRVQVTNTSDEKSTKHAQSRILVRKTDLEKLKQRSESVYTNLLQSVQKYDIGKISEDCDPEQLPMTKLDRPRYALLARITRKLQSILMTRLRSALKKQFNIQQTHQNDIQFEFVFCVDNSGSMSGKKIREALNTLVILMETLHRLEWKFAVIRFGSEQKILKSLGHDSMYENISSSSTATTNTSNFQQSLIARGQYILESFTTDEKTLPATALKQIAENPNLFGCEKKQNVKRFIIMITDGISSQNDVELFTNELKRASANLYMVCIIPKLPKTKDPTLYNEEDKYAVEHEIQARQFTQRVAPQRNQLIEIGQLDTLTKTVVADLINIIDQSILHYINEIAARSTTVMNNDSSKFQPLSPLVLSQLAKIEKWQNPSIKFSGRSFISDRRRKLERQAMQEKLDGNFSVASTEFQKNFDDVMDTLERSYNSLETHDDILLHTERIFQEIEHGLETNTVDLIRVMEECILPAYKPTQSLPDTKGNRLHIPGIVRYLCTQGQYNRIYLNQIGSPKAEYRIAIILDQSVSMTGPTYFSSVDILLSLCFTFNRIGIEDFNILTCGKDIQLVKSYKQNFSSSFLHHLRNALKIDGETTLLSDAIFAAAELLQQQSNHNNNHGPMLIFVLTDGYDKRGNFIHRVISYAEQRDITVLGLGIGFESNGVSLSFNDWIIVQNPCLLVDALIDWSNDQTDGQTPNDAVFHQDMITTVTGDNQKTYSTTDDIWDDNMSTYFDTITEKTRNAVELTFSDHVQNNPLIVEICFVMDCTGSMEKWIQACKQHINGIATGVQKQLKEVFDKNSILRMAFVGYRDYKDADRFDWIDFHPVSNLQAVEKKIADQKATGGDDLCEDVQGGLAKALQLNWTKDNKSRPAQILVWVGDYPGHTEFCHNQGSKWDKHLNGLPDVPLMTTIINEIKDRGIFLLLSDFTEQVQIMLQNIEQIYKNQRVENQVKRIKLNQADTSSLLKEVQQQIKTIIASEFM